MDSTRPKPVSPLALLIAFAVPIAVAGLAAILLAASAGNTVRLIGIPREHVELLAAVSHSEADISEEQAIETAIRGTRDISDGRVLDTALGRYPEEPAFIDSGRLVWVVSLGPDKGAPVFLSGPADRDRSCDWAAHYDWVVATVDAKSGEFLGYGTGASFDPSLPPTYERPGDADRAYCERLAER